MMTVILMEKMFTITFKSFKVILKKMVMWSPSQTGGFPPGTHMKTIKTQTSVPTSMIYISCITCFVIVVK